MKQTKKIIMLVVCCLLSIILERPFSWMETGQSFFDYLLRDEFFVEIDLMAQDFHTKNYVFRNGYYQSTSKDGQFVFPKLNQKLSNVRIVFAEPIAHADETVRGDSISVFYTLTTGGSSDFTEEQAVKSTLPAGSREILLQMKQKDIKDLRIDIGAAEGDKFRLESIHINDFSTGRFWVGFASKACVTRIFLLFLICAFIGLHFVMPISVLYDYLYRYRFQIAICILVVGTALQLSGSSIGVWKQYLPQSEAQGPLFGVSRSIRSDEWGVQTPMALSQQYGNYGYFNEIVRATKTDVEIVYGQPIRSWLNIFRPYYWGYVLLPVENGIAFYWISRFLGLFLTTFEFGMILCNKNRRIALFLAVAVSLAPAVQWWYSILAVVDVFLFGQLALIATYYYMRTEKYLYRALWAAAFVVACGGYVLIFYPPSQIPGAYLYFVLFLWIIFSNRKWFRFVWKKDVPIMVAALVVLCAGMGQVLLSSADTIQTVLQTSYPGKRFIQGGNINNFIQFLRYPGNLFFPFQDTGMPRNVCASSSMIDFFPMGFILSVIVLEREKKVDKCLAAMLMVDIFLIAWNLFTFPAWYAKITLLSMVQPERNLLIIGYLNLLILSRALLLYQKEIKKGLALGVGICVTIMAVMYSREILGEYLTIKRALVCGVFFGVLFVSILRFHNLNAKRIFTVGTVLLFLMAGVGVNPVQQGLEVVYENPLTQKIQTIAGQEEGRWLAVNLSTLSPNLLPMAGAKAINSVNAYPQLELWERLDSEGVYYDIYNRYAHIRVEITEEPTWFELLQSDVFTIHLSEKDLPLLEADFILTKGKLNFNSSNCVLELLDQVEDFYIYKIQFNKNMLES